jgi:hypothetical protein
MIFVLFVTVSIFFLIKFQKYILLKSYLHKQNFSGFSVKMLKDLRTV